MRKIYLLLLALLPVAAFSQERIMVIADPHVLASSLMEDGEALGTMMASQRKMIDLSETAWLAAMDTALKYKPALVLIPGDLTKDSEVASHEVVINQLRRLHEAGIKTLVIPGNHDIGGKAYAYKGAEKTEVESMPDQGWEIAYDWIYKDAVSKDTDSHSFASEPLDGLTVLGIDGSHGSEGIGSLSAQTLEWVLAQADAAAEKGNMIIAMTHWQLLEDFDKKSMMESACRMKDADALRDSLLHHHVHLVLTGHFHVNAISTYRDTLSTSMDSIVEISTGSLVTFPCPYRWLTISENREEVTVESAALTAIGNIPDLRAYSREWMRAHTANMIPEMTLRVWRRADEALALIRENPKYGGEALAAILEQSMPKTDEERVALVERNLGNTVVELYLLYSEANEPGHPEADSLAQEVYAGLDKLIHEMTDATMGNIFFRSMQDFLITTAKTVAKEPVQSLVEDKTDWKSAFFADRTDDLQVRLRINARAREALDQIDSQENDGAVYDMLGRRYNGGLPHGVYIQNGQKIVR